MDDVIEFVLELILEGTLELSSNRKVPKWIRYPLIVIISLLFAIVTFGLIILGVISSKENIYIGIFFIVVGLILLVAGIIKVDKIYIEKKEKISNLDDK